MGGNDGNGVGSDAKSEDGTDEGTALDIPVGKARSVDDNDGVELICSVVLVWRTRLE